MQPRWNKEQLSKFGKKSKPRAPLTPPPTPVKGLEVKRSSPITKRKRMRWMRGPFYLLQAFRHMQPMLKGMVRGVGSAIRMPGRASQPSKSSAQANRPRPAGLKHYGGRSPLRRALGSVRAGLGLFGLFNIINGLLGLNSNNKSNKASAGKKNSSGAPRNLTPSGNHSSGSGTGTGGRTQEGVNFHEEDANEFAPEPRNMAESKHTHTPFTSFQNSRPRLVVLYAFLAVGTVYLLSGLAWRQVVQQGDYTLRGEQQSLRRIVRPGPRGDFTDRNGKLLVGNRPRFSAVVYLNELRPKLRTEYLKLVRQAREANPEAPLNRTALQTQARTDVLQRYLNEINAILYPGYAAALETQQAAEAEAKKQARALNMQNPQLQVLIERKQGATTTNAAAFPTLPGEMPENFKGIEGLKLNPKAIARHFRQRLLLPFPLVDDLTPQQYALLTEQLPVNSPVQLYTDSARYYPYSTAAAHTLGYVGRTKDVDGAGLPGEGLRTFAFAGNVGRAGMERYLEQTVGGAPGSEVWRVDPVGFQYELEEAQVPVRGESVQLSLDINLQQTAERALANKTGAVVALEVDTGEILTLVSKPHYNLNDLSPRISQATFQNIEERGAWLNRATQGRYPPGSTFKLITAIAALRAGVLEADEQIECGPFFTLGNRNLPEHGGNAYGMVNLQRALQVSSNVYFYQVALRLGQARLVAEAKRFGLGEKTGLELPAEGSGLVPTPQWKQKRWLGPWVAGDTTNMSIGQGYLITTPLQMAAATASIARGETRTQVTLLHKPQQETINHGGEPIGLTKKQYQTLVAGMVKAAQPGGTAKLIAVPGLPIAAKTGSAQFRAKGQELTLAWVVAFAPVENPKIAIAVMVEGTDPGDNYYGGATAAPIAREVFKAWLANQ